MLRERCSRDARRQILGRLSSLLDPVALRLDFQSETGLNVVLDERALDEEGKLVSEPVSESLREVPSYQFLNRLASLVKSHPSGELKTFWKERDG
jgi:hypothetical protein